MKFYDPYNTQLEVGQVVAFNYCGQVRIGKILSVKASKRKFALDTSCRITVAPRNADGTGFDTRCPSVVSNSQNLVVVTFLS